MINRKNREHVEMVSDLELNMKKLILIFMLSLTIVLNIPGCKKQDNEGAADADKGESQEEKLTPCIDTENQQQDNSSDDQSSKNNPPVIKNEKRICGKMAY